MADRDDIATVCAVAVLAMVAATAAHEAMGHGGACLLSGGHITRLTSVYFECAPSSRWIAVAGPVGNLACGAAAWLGLRLLPATAAWWRLFAFLAMAFSFCWFAGYLVYAMALDTGDYVFAARIGRDPLPPAARAGGVALGVALYWLTARLLSRQAFGRDVRRTAWLAATVSAMLAALPYAPGRGAAAFQALLEIGAASLPLLLARNAGTAPALQHNRGWIAAALLVFVIFAVTLGQGIA